MKNHRLRDIVLGMLLMTLVMGLALPVFAAKGSRAIQADYADIKLVVDGKEVTPKDANGNVVEPFAAAGTTYLPVRAVAEALGKEVAWDGNTNTVYLGQVPAGETKDWVGIIDVDKAMGGFTKNAKDLPHIAAAIAETNATVESDFGVRPKDALTSQYVRLEAHDTLAGRNTELWITGMTDYWGYQDSKDFLKLMRAILEDTVSSGEDVENIMKMVAQLDATYDILLDWAVPEAKRTEAKNSRDKILDNTYEFDTVMVRWGGKGGYTDDVLRIWSK